MSFNCILGKYCQKNLRSDTYFLRRHVFEDRADRDKIREIRNLFQTNDFFLYF